MGRKWSLDMEEMSNYEEVPEALKKYLPSALKEHGEIKACSNPDQELRKIMKLFEGGKSMDI